MIKVAVLDDHTLVLKGLESMLLPESSIEVVATYSRGVEMIEKIAHDKPDVLLLDITLADSNGIELCKSLKQEHPSLKIIALSNHSETGFIKNMIRNGAKGYLLKNTDREELVKAIAEVHAGKQYIPRNIQDILLNESLGRTVPFSNIPKLTRREKEVLQLIGKEHINQEIAELLFISTKTVESHRNNLLQKLRARNTAGLIKTAMELGLLA